MIFIRFPCFRNFKKRLFLVFSEIIQCSVKSCEGERTILLLIFVNSAFPKSKYIYCTSVFHFPL